MRKINCCLTVAAVYNGWTVLVTNLMLARQESHNLIQQDAQTPTRCNDWVMVQLWYNRILKRLSLSVRLVTPKDFNKKRQHLSSKDQ